MNKNHKFYSPLCFNISKFKTYKTEGDFFTPKHEKKLLEMRALRPFPGESAIVDNEQAFHIAIGSVLGDGTISKRDFNLEMEQKSATYTLWKQQLCVQCQLRMNRINSKPYKQFKLLGNLPSNLPFTCKMHRKKDKQTGKIKQYRSFSFATRALFRFEWRDLFYTPVSGKGKREYRKRIPPQIKDYFWGDLALAIFFLDDGWYDKQKKTVRLSTGEWPREECEWLTDCLLQNFNLHTEIYPLTGEPHHIYIKRNSYNAFYERVNPFLLFFFCQFARVYPKYPRSAAMKTKVLQKF